VICAHNVAKCMLLERGAKSRSPVHSAEMNSRAMQLRIWKHVCACIACPLIRSYGEVVILPLYMPTVTVGDTPAEATLITGHRQVVNSCYAATL